MKLRKLGKLKLNLSAFVKVDEPFTASLPLTLTKQNKSVTSKDVIPMLKVRVCVCLLFCRYIPLVCACVRAFVMWPFTASKRSHSDGRCFLLVVCLRSFLCCF